MASEPVQGWQTFLTLLNKEAREMTYLQHTQVVIDYVHDRIHNGCGNGGCVVKTPGGQHTNGPCHCCPRDIAKILIDLACAIDAGGNNWKKEKCEK